MTITELPIIIGKFGSVHGIRGWIRLESYTENQSAIFSYQPWLIKQQAQWLEIKCEAHKPYQKYYLVKIANYDSKEEAAHLTGITIHIPQSTLPKLSKNEYYWSDLIGLTVFDQQGIKLGIIQSVMATGANDVLIIKNDQNNKEYGIPFLVDTVIKSIELDAKKMIVNWVLV